MGLHQSTGVTPRGKIDVINSDCVAITLPAEMAHFDVYRATCRSLKLDFGGWWDSQQRAWIYPAQAVDTVLRLLPPDHFDITSAIEQLHHQHHAIVEQATTEQRAFFEEAQQRLGDLSRPLPGGWTLYEHQIAAIWWTLERHHAILALDMGLGKTIIALMAAKAYNLPIWVIAPKSMKESWERTAVVADVEVTVFSWAKVPDPPSYPFIVLGDEAHYAQNIRSKRGAAFVKLCRAATAALPLTGTPMKNGRPSNLYPLLHAIDHPIARDKRAYEVRYCNAGPTRFSRWDITGASNLDELRAKTAGSILYWKKRDCIDLPVFQRILRPVEITDSAQADYQAHLDRLRERYLSRLAAGVVKPGGEKLVLLTHLRQAGAIAKVPEAIERAIEIIQQGSPVVLYTGFLAVTQSLRDGIDAAGYASDILSGETAGQDRQAMIDRFQDGRLDAMIITDAGGVGVTLTAAHTIILVDRPWTPGDVEQIEARIDRIGQTAATTSLWLQYGQADQRIDSLQVEKNERIRAVLLGTDEHTSQAVTLQIEEINQWYWAQLELVVRDSYQLE
jgi:SNF2 family DNA or RNA helicase